MSSGRLSAEEKKLLLRLARRALECAAKHQPLPPLVQADLSPLLKEMGASFVTLTKHGELRGCIGALEAYQPLAEDVCEHAVAAATEDYRFPPVEADELRDIEVEVSYLTPAQALEYDLPEDLAGHLRPGIDGVVLSDGWLRATFLPQVWEKIPDPELFLGYLCQKMGAPMDTWRRKKLNVQVYQVEEFRE